MRNTSLSFIALALPVALTLSLAGQSSPPADLRAADLAWDQGDDITALTDYIRLLSDPSADTVLEPIAIQTGELYRTDEITADGLAARLSPDGRPTAYETGTGLGVKTRIVTTADGHAQVAEFTGRGAVFSPTANTVAYLKLTQADELTQAQKTLAALPAQSPQRIGAQARLAWLQFKHSAIVLRDLGAGQETGLKTDGLLKSALAFAAEGQSAYFVGAREDDTSRSDIYAVSETVAPVRVTEADGYKTSPIVDPGGVALIYTVTAANPFRRPDSPAPGGAGALGGQPWPTSCRAARTRSSSRRSSARRSP